MYTMYAKLKLLRRRREEENGTEKVWGKKLEKMSGVKDKEEDMKERKREMNGRGWGGINSSFQAPSLSGDEKMENKMKRKQN